MSDTPEFMNPSTAMEAMQTHATGTEAVSKLREAARSGKLVEVQDDEDKPRMFLTPTHLNGKFLIRKGTLVEAPFQTAALGLKPAISRDGDLFVKFSSGIVATRDPDVIAWLEAHSGDPAVHNDYHKYKGENPRECTVPIGLCHEQGPGVDVWAELKAGQLPTASRPAVISPDIDVDAFLRGDHVAPQRLNTGEGARLAAAGDAANNADRERADGQRNR